MQKAIVMYSSVYGTTKQYAEWIAEEIKGEACDVKKVKQDTLKDYDIIILGGGLYAGMFKGLDIIKKNYEVIKDKKIIVFTCGLADVTYPENIASIHKRIAKVLTDDIVKDIKIFYLRGGLDYSKLSFLHKTMMAVMKKSVARIPEDKKTDDDRMLLETYGKTIDFMDRKSVGEILEYCRS